jgi:hypothetical protein
MDWYPWEPRPSLPAEGSNSVARGGETASWLGLRHRHTAKAAGNSEAPSLPTSSKTRPRLVPPGSESGAREQGLTRNLGDVEHFRHGGSAARR